MNENERADELWRRVESLKRDGHKAPSRHEQTTDGELEALAELAGRVDEALGSEVGDASGRAFARARLEAAMAQTLRRRRHAVRRPLLWGTMAAAALLLVVGLGRHWRAAAALPAGDLIKDHIELLGNPAPAQYEASDARKVAAWLESRVGFPVAPVALPAADSRLMGGRHCRLKGHNIGLTFYRCGDQRVSLFQMTNSQVRVSGLEEVRVAGRSFFITSDKGFNVAAWQGRENFCVMVSACDASKLLQVAETASTQTG